MTGFDEQQWELLCNARGPNKHKEWTISTSLANWRWLCLVTKCGRGNIARTAATRLWLVVLSRCLVSVWCARAAVPREGQSVWHISTGRGLKPVCLNHSRYTGKKWKKQIYLLLTSATFRLLTGPNVFLMIDFEEYSFIYLFLGKLTMTERVVEGR